MFGSFCVEMKVVCSSSRVDAFRVASCMAWHVWHVGVEMFWGFGGVGVVVRVERVVKVVRVVRVVAQRLNCNIATMQR